MTTTADTQKLKITYFDIEGAAEPIRLALLLAGVDFIDDRLAFKDWPDFKLKTPYGQVPVMTLGDDGEMKAQSGAILRYIAKTYSKTLYPDEALYEVEEAMGVMGDVRNSWAPNLYIGMQPENFGYGKDFPKTDEGKAKIKEMREAWVKNKMPTMLGHLTTLLKRHDNQWLASTDFPTIADCDAVVFLRSFTKGHMEHVPTTVLEDYPELVTYVKRFCALPQIKGRYTDGLHE